MSRKMPNFLSFQNFICKLVKIKWVWVDRRTERYFLSIIKKTSFFYPDASDKCIKHFLVNNTTNSFMSATFYYVAGLKFIFTKTLTTFECMYCD